MIRYYLKQQGRTLCDDDIQNVEAVFGWDPTKSQQRDTLMTVSITPLSWLFWTDTSTDLAYLGLPMEGEIPTKRITLNSHGGLGERSTYICGQHYVGSYSVCCEKWNLCIALRWWSERRTWCCATGPTPYGMYKLSDRLLLLIPKTTTAPSHSCKTYWRWHSEAICHSFVSIHHIALIQPYDTYSRLPIDAYNGLWYLSVKISFALLVWLILCHIQQYNASYEIGIWFTLVQRWFKVCAQTM